MKTAKFRIKVSKKECVHKGRLCVMCHLKPDNRPTYVDFDKGGKKDEEPEIGDNSEENDK